MLVGGGSADGSPCCRESLPRSLAPTDGKGFGFLFLLLIVCLSQGYWLVQKIPSITLHPSTLNQPQALFCPCLSVAIIFWTIRSEQQAQFYILHFLLSVSASPWVVTGLPLESQTRKVEP